jgi:hypothetical protein
METQDDPRFNWPAPSISSSGVAGGAPCGVQEHESAGPSTRAEWRGVSARRDDRLRGRDAVEIGW